MNGFQISELAGLSGINAHTIRIWESRYTILTPGRDKGNYRSYSLKDLDHLLKIALLNRSRFKISKLAVMDAAGIELHLKNLNSVEEQQCRSADKLIISMFAMNTEEFEAVLDSCIIHWGIDQTIKKVIIPFIERTKLFSCRNCECEKDLVITILRKKIIFGIETIDPGAYSSKTLLMFLPGQEYFDLLLLYTNYLAKLNGFSVLYMGTNVSVNKVKHVINAKQPQHVITYVSENKKSLLGYTDVVPGMILLSTGSNDDDQQSIHFNDLPALLASL